MAMPPPNSPFRYPSKASRVTAGPTVIVRRSRSSSLAPFDQSQLRAPTRSLFHDVSEAKCVAGTAASPGPTVANTPAGTRSSQVVGTRTGWAVMTGVAVGLGDRGVEVTTAAGTDAAHPLSSSATAASALT